MTIIEAVAEGGINMNWETPSLVEIKMDAEINSYQDDFRDVPDVRERPAEVPVMTTPQE